MTLRGGNSTDACSEQAGARWADAPGTGRSCARPAVSRRGRDKRRRSSRRPARAPSPAARVCAHPRARERARRGPQVAPTIINCPGFRLHLATVAAVCLLDTLMLSSAIAPAAELAPAAGEPAMRERRDGRSHPLTGPPAARAH